MTPIWQTSPYKSVQYRSKRADYQNHFLDRATVISVEYISHTGNQKKIDFNHLYRIETKRHATIMPS